TVPRVEKLNSRISIDFNHAASVALNLATLTNLPRLSGSATVGYPGVFSVSGTVSLQLLPGGLADFTIDGTGANNGVTIYAGTGNEVLSVKGRISFRIGGAEGFRLQDVRLDGISLFGQSLAFPNLQPPSADLAKPVNGGVIVTSDFTYLDVLFHRKSSAA